MWSLHTMPRRGMLNHALANLMKWAPTRWIGLGPGTDLTQPQNTDLMSMMRLTCTWAHVHYIWTDPQRKGPHRSAAQIGCTDCPPQISWKQGRSYLASWHFSILYCMSAVLTGYNWGSAVVQTYCRGSHSMFSISDISVPDICNSIVSTKEMQ